MWDSLGFWTWVLLPFRLEVFSYNHIKYFSALFFCLFFWDPYDLNTGALNIVPGVLRSFLHFIFIFDMFLQLTSTALSHSSLYHSSHHSVSRWFSGYIFNLRCYNFHFDLFYIFNTYLGSRFFQHSISFYSASQFLYISIYFQDYTGSSLSFWSAPGFRLLLSTFDCLRYSHSFLFSPCSFT